jgi:hypothetical protein
LWLSCAATATERAKMASTMPVRAPTAHRPTLCCYRASAAIRTPLGSAPARRRSRGAIRRLPFHRCARQSLAAQSPLRAQTARIRRPSDVCVHVRNTCFAKFYVSCRFLVNGCFAGEFCCLCRVAACFRAGIGSDSRGRMLRYRRMMMQASLVLVVKRLAWLVAA